MICEPIVNKRHYEVKSWGLGYAAYHVSETQKHCVLVEKRSSLGRTVMTRLKLQPEGDRYSLGDSRTDLDLMNPFVACAFSSAVRKQSKETAISGPLFKVIQYQSIAPEEGQLLEQGMTLIPRRDALHGAHSRTKIMLHLFFTCPSFHGRQRGPISAEP